MNRQRHSLAMRKQAVDHLIAHGRSSGISETILEAAEDGADFIAWVVKREKLLRELERLETAYAQETGLDPEQVLKQTEQAA